MQKIYTMQEFIQLILTSGKSAVNLALYILLPVLVLMMGLMEIFVQRGLLYRVSRLLSPALSIFGIPGIGIFAMLQILLVNFAAPLATFIIMEKDGTISKRKIAATLAMVLTMSQANAVFPLAIVGLNVPITILSSILGSILAASATYYLFSKKSETPDNTTSELRLETTYEKKGLLKVFLEGGENGMQMALKAIPILVFAIFIVNILKVVGAINVIQGWLSPLFQQFNLPSITILPILTKYLAGGTAMMGVTMDLIQKKMMTGLDLNRIAGFMINPLDMVGVAFFISAGPRVASVLKPAMLGAIIGILFRAVFHVVYFL